MKLIHVLVFAMLIFISKEFSDVNCQDYLPDANSNTKSAFSLDLCRSSKFETSQYAKCCFIKWKYNEKRRYNCVLVTPIEWSDIDIFKNSFENKWGEDSIVSLECKSSYLYGSIFLILALLF